MFCPYCGEEVADTAKFCTGCGKSLREIPRAPRPETQATPVTQVEPRVTYTAPAAQVDPRAAYSAPAAQSASPVMPAAQPVRQAQTVSICSEPFTYREPFRWQGARKGWLKTWMILLSILGSLILLGTWGETLEGTGIEWGMLITGVSMLVSAIGCALLYLARKKLGLWLTVGGSALLALASLPDIETVFVSSLFSAGLPLGTFLFIRPYWKKLS